MSRRNHGFITTEKVSHPQTNRFNFASILKCENTEKNNHSSTSLHFFTLHYYIELLKIYKKP